MVAAVVGGSTPHTQIITAAITLVASLFGLVTIYVEDFSGGEGSTRRLRDLMTTQVRRLAEIDGQLRLALVQDDSAKILSSLTDIRSVLVEVQYARAQLGLVGAVKPRSDLEGDIPTALRARASRHNLGVSAGRQHAYGPVRAQSADRCAAA
jgi:hypothetical protein